MEANQRATPVGRPIAVSELLRSIDRSDAGEHSIPDYARAMEKFPGAALSILAIGSDTISLVLEDGNVLKVGTRILTPEMGTRPFDLPITKRGTRKVQRVSVHYFIQPRAENVSDHQYAQFVRDVARLGYWFSDPGKRNAGYYAAQNRVVLIDPWAVEKLP
jgi:hypothetical protein